MRLEPFETVRKGVGLLIVKALELGAADLLQKADLFLRLHALADRLQAQRRGHLHQLGQNDLPAISLVQLLHEAHVEFDQVKANALQNVQGRVAAAEIVHPHREAEILKTRDLFLDKGKVAADDALGDLDGDPVAADARLIHAPADLLNHITGVEIRPGQVDGVRDNEEPLLFQRMDVLQHPLQHVKIHLVNESRVLQRGDKAPRREKALYRVNPARQRLLITDLLVDGPDDRLVKDLNPSLLDSSVDILDDVLPHLRFVAELLRVITITGGVGPAQLVAGEGRLEAALSVGIDAHMNRERFSSI